MADAVRLDTDATCLEGREIVPLDRLVANALRSQRLLVRQGTVAVEEADGNEDHRRVAVLPKNGQSVLEIVAIPVVERDQDRAGRKRGAVDVVVAHLLE